MRDRRQEHRSRGSGSAEQRRYVSGLAFAFGLAIVGISLVLPAQPAAAQELEPEGAGPRWNSEGCLSCHDGSEDTLVFPSGEELSVAVDGGAFLGTEHVSVGVECAHCHGNIVKTPHDPVAFPDAASFSDSLATSCSQCHWRQERIRLDQTHALLDLDVRGDAPGCVQCHDPHATEALALSSPEMQATCRDCHEDQVWTEVEAIHVLDPTIIEEADPPPLILFYGLIIGAVALIVVIAWGGVAAYQWFRQRQVQAA